MASSESSLIDVVTSHDEAEDDIANNNDPNNNAGNGANNGTIENLPNMNENESANNIDDEISNILSLLPHSDREDIRTRLLKHWSNPLRQQEVTNELMDMNSESFDPDLTNFINESASSFDNTHESYTSQQQVKFLQSSILTPLNHDALQPTTSQVSTDFSADSFSNLKNKTGNGLKSKNSNRRQAEITQNGASVGDAFIPKRLKLEQTDNTEINVEGIALLAQQLEQDAKEFVASTMPTQTNTSALSSSNCSASSSSSTSPTPIIGPPWKIGQISQSSTPLAIMKKIPPPLVDLATPEVITVEETPSPQSQSKEEPIVVDLCQTDKKEVEMLYNDFCQMFPNTPKLFLEQQASDLVGKHAAINRFIDELFENNSKPPEYWRPDVLESSSDGASNGRNQKGNQDQEITQISIQHNRGQQNDLISSLATKEMTSEPKTTFLENPALHCLEEEKVTLMSDKSNTIIPTESVYMVPENELDNYQNPVPGPSGIQKSSFVPNESVGIPNLLIDSQLEPEPSKVLFPTHQDTLKMENGSQPETIEIEPQSINTTEVTDTEEEKREQKMDKRVQNLLSLFPQKDPEYLRAKNNEFGLDAAGVTAFETWVLEVVENGGKDLPSREDYDKRKKEEEVLEKYSGQVTVEEVLKWYGGDPEAYFSDLLRKVDELYKKHSLAQLKKEFRTTTVATIDKIFRKSNGLYVPSYRALKQHQAPKRKTKRPDHECGHPKEICLNFLKELQYSKIDQKVIRHIEEQKENKRNMIENARKSNTLQECGCCYNDECLLDDMLPCRDAHTFCTDCVQRASEVAMGDGKITLECLGNCEAIFDITVLQKALKPDMFSKWFRKIQMAEIGEAGLQGLEECPFCQYTTIMDTTPEENKIFHCLHPDCGIETCRLCHEMSHIPLRCDEVEKDAEVRKRTYIENKMTEALVRKCWKCHKPFIKIDGCNKMTCECGAQMCYLCRKPVHNGYNHFYGQGGSPKAGRNCPLFTNNNEIHESDVARGAQEAKAEMDTENPTVTLKHDPTDGIKLPNEMADQPEKKEGDGLLGGLLPADPRERERFLREQQQLLDNIRRNNNPNHDVRAAAEDLARDVFNPNINVRAAAAEAARDAFRGNVRNPFYGNLRNPGNHNDLANGNILNVPDIWDANQGQAHVGRNRHGINEQVPVIAPHQHPFAPPVPFQRPQFDVQPSLQPQAAYPPPLPGHAHQGLGIQNPYPDYNGFVDRMGELLQLREAQRQRQRAIRRREQQALEAFQIHRIAATNETNQPQIPNQVGVIQTQPNHRQQNVPNQPNVISNAVASHINKQADTRTNVPFFGPMNQPHVVKQMQHNNQYINPAANPLQVATGLHMQDHHYAYHQRIQRHLNPVPNPIQPPPNAGGHVGNGPPPPAHSGIPHTVDLVSLTPVTASLFSHHNSLPPIAHPQRAHQPSTSTMLKPIPNMTGNLGAAIMRKTKSPIVRNTEANLGTISAATFTPGTSGMKFSSKTLVNMKQTESSSTKTIAAVTHQSLSKSKPGRNLVNQNHSS